MFGYKRIVVAQHQRGLKMQDQKLVDILHPGVYHLLDYAQRVEVKLYDVTVPEFRHNQLDVLLNDSTALMAEHFRVFELGEFEIGLVYQNAKLADVLAPGTRAVFWKGPIDIDVKVLDIKEDYEVPQAVTQLLARSTSSGLASKVSHTIGVAEIADNKVGLLIEEGALVKTLAPGLHVYWKFLRNIKVEIIDLRLQVMEVSGQEILTKDKVSLRVNLSAHYQVTDAVTARNQLNNFVEYLYRELQFALRSAISAQTLDVLLSEKSELDNTVFTLVKNRVEPYGLKVVSVGVKDVILPGDMKEILNQVVTAEKAAQANVIKRREETAATRSLLNTAKLMEGNPTLLRLKELETLEKVTDKIERLTVFGGLDGVINDMVRINIPTK
ncbi:MAG: slipin family protein [Gammaproteobacteria bacterium]|nr:slipin family protein [Gammaproteobacteria bacterium]MDH5727642.1 slipin family protein [Gammaproteobacteria bacterium]